MKKKSLIVALAMVTGNYIYFPYPIHYGEKERKENTDLEFIYGNNLRLGIILSLFFSSVSKAITVTLKRDACLNCFHCFFISISPLTSFYLIFNSSGCRK